MHFKTGVFFIAAVAGVGATGCHGAILSAHLTRAPILVGPVHCIGCAAGERPVTQGEKISALGMKMDAEHSSHGYTVAETIETSSTVLDQEVAKHIAANDCGSDVVLDHLEATQTTLTIWLAWYVDVHRVLAKGDVQRIQGGSCVVGQADRPTEKSLSVAAAARGAR